VEYAILDNPWLKCLLPTQQPTRNCGGITGENCICPGAAADTIALSLEYNGQDS